MNKIISGRGYRSYLSCFEQKTIKPGDNLVVQNHDNSENYFVNEDSSLDWANVLSKNKLKNKGLDGDLDYINPADVLRKKRWYIEKKGSCIRDFSDSEIFE